MPKIAGYSANRNITREGKQWTALCNELGTATCGDTIEEVREAMASLIQLHLNTLESVGARRSFFQQHSITFHRVRPKDSARRVPVRPGRLVERFTEAVAV